MSKINDSNYLEKLFINEAEPALDRWSSNSSADIDVTAEVGQTIIVKEVDENGKPTKWESAEYQPRTHWRGENVEGDIVPLTTFVPVLYEYLGCTTYPLTPFKLEEGKSYTVIFDGVEYPCTAKTFAMSNMEGVFIGNDVFAGGENNGMPFAAADFVAKTTADGNVIAEDEYFYVLCMDTEQHTVRVVGEETVYHKIPDEYVKTNFIVNFGVNIADNSIVMVTPWEQVIDAIKTGKNIIGLGKSAGYEFDDEYGQLINTYNVTNRGYLLNSKIGWGDYEQCCELIFLWLGTDDLFLRVKRDINGVTTIEETYGLS